MCAVRGRGRAGAVAANYVEATGFVRDGDRIRGVRARDKLSGQTFDIRARATLNAAGTYAERLLEKGLELRLSPPGMYSRDLCLVVPRRLLDGELWFSACRASRSR